MTTRSIVLLATLLLAPPASAQQDQFEAATLATSAACVEHLRPEELPPCVLALQRQVCSCRRSCSIARRGSGRWKTRYAISATSNSSWPPWGIA